MHALLDRDEYFVLRDYASYVAAQDAVTAAWRDTDRWTRMSIANAAQSGWFSSDRAIAEYRERIWNTRSVHVDI